MEAPLKVDYPTTDDEGTNDDFRIKIPDIYDLINEFERDDDYLYKTLEKEKQERNEYRLKGLEMERRAHLRDYLGEGNK